MGVAAGYLFALHGLGPGLPDARTVAVTVGAPTVRGLSARTPSPGEGAQAS